MCGDWCVEELAVLVLSSSSDSSSSLLFSMSAITLVNTLITVGDTQEMYVRFGISKMFS